MQGLTMGRVIHVKVGADMIRPATVTRVLDAETGRVSAKLHMDPLDPPGEPIDERTGQSISADLVHDPELQEVGTWRWPPRA